MLLRSLCCSFYKDAVGFQMLSNLGDVVEYELETFHGKVHDIVMLRIALDFPHRGHDEHEFSCFHSDLIMTTTFSVVAEPCG